MSDTNKFRAGDQVLWKHESGENFPVTISRPPEMGFKAIVELAEYPETILHGRTGKTQFVSEDQLFLKENLKPHLEIASRDRMYASRFLEEALSRQGVPLNNEQRVIVWAALEHILLKEKLGLGWR